ncbi:MAG: carboxypeptidase-like regulatory domain-containing protein [Bacteroidales bacterium]|nr:carboxypeptidase-like regulatory domain-containing protein [Bacteroidales bacterium]
MKIKIIILVLIFSSNWLSAQNTYVNINCTNTKFQDFCEDITAQSNVNIYYSDIELNKLSVNLILKQSTPLNAVKHAVDTLMYQVVLWNNDIVITKDYIIPTSVVQYTYEQKVTNKDEIDIIVPQESQYYETAKAGVLQKIIIGNVASFKANTKVQIEGKILHSETGLVIPGATIFFKIIGKGAVADKEGIARLVLATGKYNMVVKSVGMKEQEYRLVVYDSGSFEVILQTKSVELSSINIYGDRQMSLMKRDPGIEKVSGKTLKKLPVMVGEPDVVKASTMLPGIVSVGEGTSGINVRGGGSDQNAFYINKIPVFNTSHMLGFFPAFNADLIRDFTIYKGYIPPEFGGKLSSVFDIETRKGNRKNFSLHGGLSPMAANLVTSIPIIKDTLSVLLSGRKSYSNWILKKVEDRDINRSEVDFSDFSLGIYYDLPKTQVSLFGYRSYDRFAFSDLNEYQYSTNGVSLQVAQSYGKKLRANYSLVGSLYEFGTRDKIEPSRSYSHEYSIMQNELKADFTYTFNIHHRVKFGLNSVYYGLDRGEVLPLYKSKMTAVDMGAEKGIENSIYITDIWNPFEWLELNGGFRYTLYNALGPKNIYTYNDGNLIDEYSISDTLVYGKNEIISTNHFPEFRFAANIIASKKSNVKVSFTQMHQSLFMLNPIATVAPSSQWKLADYHLKPSTSNQYSLGYFRDITRFGVEASAEVYYKHTKDFTEFRDGANFLGNEKVELSTLQGDQKSYGFEFMLRRRGEYRFTGWFAYTFSRSIVEVKGDDYWQNINNGNPYPSSYDIPHSVNLFLNIKLSKRVNFSTTINYQTGRPITFPISIYYINNVTYVDYSDRNAYRIPYYFRMDASLTVEGSLKRDKFVHSSFVFSIYNLTGRDNPYSVYFTAQSNGVKAHQYSVIAIPVITATWVFKLGNFDAN